jgi:hypothetical protein
MGTVLSKTFESSKQATAQVGAAELNLLRERWVLFRSVADSNRADFDPVASLRSTGALFEAVEDVIATACGDQAVNEAP